MMALAEEVRVRAAAVLGELEAKQEALLGLLCETVVVSLGARLRSGVRPEDIREDFLLAASLLVLAEMENQKESGGIQEFRAGDLTVKQDGGNGAQRGLGMKQQAMGLLGPYLKDSLAFLGV